jgi:hypothetical protein
VCATTRLVSRILENQAPLKERIDLNRQPGAERCAAARARRLECSRNASCHQRDDAGLQRRAIIDDYSEEAEQNAGKGLISSQADHVYLLESVN